MSSVTVAEESTTIGARLATRHWIKAVFILVVASALYFITRTPCLDEVDSVNFAMGLRHFNIWEDQPHAPGYPLFIFLGSIGLKIFHASPDLSLHFLSALGGGLFVASWFLIIRLQFNERLAWWLTGCLVMTPVVWMTATKALSDSLAAGLLSAEILAAVYFAANGRWSSLLATAVLGAAAAGIRPQLLPVVFVVMGTAFIRRRISWNLIGAACAAMAAATLLWLLPMWYTQWQLRPETSAQVVYPKLLYTFWSGGVHDPTVTMLASDWSPRYIALRFVFHILGWFGLGLGFIQSWPAFVIGTIIGMTGLVSLLRIFSIEDSRFWKFHLPWAVVHIAIIFVNVPATQRYYLVIFPLLLTALLRGFLGLARPWNSIAVALPAFLLCTTIPLAAANHRYDAPPLQLVKYLEKLYPHERRSRVALLLSTRTERHAEWYAPDFVTYRPLPPPEAWPELTKDAVAVYTDDSTIRLPRGWYRIPLIAFERSPVIYWKGHYMELYLIDRHAAEGNRSSNNGPVAPEPPP